MDAQVATSDAPQYPIRYDVDYPEQLNRWLILVKFIFVIPVLLLWYLLSALSYLPVAAFFTIRKKYPKWWFDALVSFVAFNQRIFAYALLLRDEYPALEEEQAGLPLVKWLLAVPHYLVLIVIAFLAYICVVIAWFAILFTGRFPRGLFDFVVGVQRWGLRVSAYAFYLVTDEYPPFSLK